MTADVITKISIQNAIYNEEDLYPKRENPSQKREKLSKEKENRSREHRVMLQYRSSSVGTGL